MNNKQFYAGTRSWEFKSLVNGSEIYKFQTFDKAFAQLQQLKRKFISSNPVKIPHNPENEIVLWVKGYKIDPSESKGRLGNFVKIKIVEVNNSFELQLEDLDIPIKNHPQKERPKHSHPNWGHPILRKVEVLDKSENTKPAEFDNAKEAESFLLALYNEYPRTTYVLPNRLITIVYSEKYPERVRSFKFDVVQKENQKYQIVAQPNHYKDVSHFKIFNHAFSLV